MDKKTPNRSIECSVSQCEYHCQNQNYCSLDSISVGTHEQNPTVVECTDCESFVSKNKSSGQTSKRSEGQATSKIEYKNNQYENPYQGQFD